MPENVDDYGTRLDHGALNLVLPAYLRVMIYEVHEMLESWYRRTLEDLRGEARR
jgi:hypothetical protein